MSCALVNYDSVLACIWAQCIRGSRSTTIPDAGYEGSYGVADHVRDEEDAPFGGAVAGFGEVGLDFADFAHAAGGAAVVLDALVAAATGLVRCHGCG